MHKCEGWRNIEIGQSAAKPWIGERSSTILKGSTPKIIRGKREAYGYIYMLIDPITTEVKYIGKTKRHLIIRLAEHFRLREDSPNKALTSYLSSIDCDPIIYFRKYPVRLLVKAEKYWIRFYKHDNKLLNIAQCPERFYDLNFKKNQMKWVGRINLETGEETRYKSVSEAAYQNRLHLENISHCLKGRRQTTGGFGWRYSQPSNES